MAVLTDLDSPGNTCADSAVEAGESNQGKKTHFLYAWCFII